MFIIFACMILTALSLSVNGTCCTIANIFFFSGVRLSPLGNVATTGLLYQPQMIDDGDCGAISGMKIDRGNRSTRRKPFPVPLCSPQIPHDLIRARTRAPRGVKPATNRLSYGTASANDISKIVKLSIYQTVEAHRFVRCRGSNIF
jgi:hypothetical protein